MTFRILLLAVFSVLGARQATAQSYCFHSGSTMLAASWMPGPLPLGCYGAPSWPMWRRFTPQHRSPAPHIGFRPGRGEAVPVIIVQYRCTGFLIEPVVASSYIYMGYVIDMPEHRCN